MPYTKFTKVVGKKKKFCIKNRRTGKIVCYNSAKKRETGIRMREMFAHL